MLIDCSHSVQAAVFRAVRWEVKKAGRRKCIWEY